MILGRFLLSFADLFSSLVTIYIWVIIIRSVISYMGNVPPNGFTIILRRLTDPVFRFVYRRLPFLIIKGIDFSPIVIILALQLFNSFFVELLRAIAAQLFSTGS